MASTLHESHVLLFPSFVALAAGQPLFTDSKMKRLSLRNLTLCNIHNTSLKDMENNKKKMLKTNEHLKRHMRERTLFGIYVYKITGRYLENFLSFDLRKVENGRYSRHFLGFLFCTICKFCSPWAFKKSSKFFFLVLGEKLA